MKVYKIMDGRPDFAAGVFFNDIEALLDYIREDLEANICHDLDIYDKVRYEIESMDMPEEEFNALEIWND